MHSTRQHLAAALFVIAAAQLCASSAHAASATATVPIILGVNAPTCTVANDNAAINLPAATSAAMTTAQYFSANAISTASVAGASRVTSAALNQNATISCNLANVTIQSFVVQPSASSSVVAGSLAMQYLVDATASTPVKAGAGNFSLGAEQVSVNGTAAAASYGVGTVVPYATAFTTGALNAGTSTAAVVWRPFFSAGNTSAIGSPVGGSFNGSYDIVVNY